MFIVGVALGARRTRDGVRSTAYRRTHPMDWSRLHGRARRTFLNGESGGRRAGLPTHWHANAVRVRQMCRAPQHSHLCGCLCAGQCNCDIPSGAFIRTTAAVAKAPPHACDPMFPWVRVGPAFREACAVCAIDDAFRRSCERAFVSLGVRGCSGRSYGPPTPIGNEYTCVSSRS